MRWGADLSKRDYKGTHVITCQLLRSQESVVGIMGFLVGKSPEGYLGYVPRANPWSFTVSDGSVEFALNFYSRKELLVGELFPFNKSAKGKRLFLGREMGL